MYYGISPCGSPSSTSPAAASRTPRPARSRFVAAASRAASSTAHCASKAASASAANAVSPLGGYPHWTCKRPSSNGPRTPPGRSSTRTTDRRAGGSRSGIPRSLPSARPGHHAPTTLLNLNNHLSIPMHHDLLRRLHHGYRSGGVNVRQAGVLRKAQLELAACKQVQPGSGLG